VNTEGDEVFPFVDKDGTLYFCSDGHTGLGGFDVYFSKATRGVWSEPENVGAPINSPYDDLSFIIHPNQKFGYFASNRDGGKGNTDLYYFSRLFVQAEVLVFDKVSGKGVENINLTCECLPKKTFTTTVDGKINVQLPLNRSCRFAIENEEFQGTGIEVSTKGFPIGSMLFAQVPLEISKLDFVAQGQVLDKETNLPMSGLKLSLLSSCNKAQLSGTSDASGNFEFKLEPNCCYVVQASAEGYFTSTANFCTKGLFKSATLNPKVTMSKLLMPKNMGLDTSSIFVMDNIYYDFGKATLNEKASTGLNKLLDLLNENPDYGVEITAHTDSRGTTTNNARLSTRRAKAVADYLIKKGVAPLRVTYRGAGETELVNGCSDGVNCSDDEHQLNRRTEFRVFRIR
jgi:outer membrane protein OmpA-like peptidoglycan-associated protein